MYCEIWDEVPHATPPPKQKDQKIVLRREGSSLYPIHFVFIFIFIIFMLSI